MFLMMRAKDFYILTWLLQVHRLHFRFVLFSFYFLSYSGLTLSSAYNYAAPIAIAMSSLESGEAMVEDVDAEAVTLEAIVTPLVSTSVPAAAPAPTFSRITR